MLCRYARASRPGLVVDLGSGTGLSTRAWSGVAERAVGIEPNAAMLAVVEPAAGVEFREAFASATGLDDGCADIVTCSQSLHWMEPGPVFAEAARILRPGGVFAAYDYDWPPVVDPEVDAAFVEYQERRWSARSARGIKRGVDRWPKREHLERMRASGRFRFCRELLLHSVEERRRGTRRGVRAQPRAAGGRQDRRRARARAARSTSSSRSPGAFSATGRCRSSSVTAFASACVRAGCSRACAAVAARAWSASSRARR